MSDHLADIKRSMGPHNHVHVDWLIAEVERWKQEALVRRERKVLCEQLQAEVDWLREGIRRTLELHTESAIRLTLQELLQGTGAVAP